MSPWFSFLGLLIELIGFLILAVDLFPEYKLYKRKKLAETLTELIEKPEWFERKRLEFEVVKGDPIPEMFQDLLEVVSNHKYDTITRDLAAGSQFRSPPDVNEYQALSRQVEEDILRSELNILNRTRPSITTGTVLVIFGVVLQLIGGWPGLPTLPPR